MSLRSNEKYYSKCISTRFEHGKKGFHIVWSLFSCWWIALLCRVNAFNTENIVEKLASFHWKVIFKEAMIKRYFSTGQSACSDCKYYKKLACEQIYQAHGSVWSESRFEPYREVENTLASHCNIGPWWHYYFYSEKIDWFIYFNVMSTQLGLFYA